MPITIPERFAYLQELSQRGEKAQWASMLVSIDLIDVRKSKGSNIVCSMPASEIEYELFKEKLTWLNPYGKADPVVCDVIDKMNINLTQWKHHHPTYSR